MKILRLAVSVIAVAACCAGFRADYLFAEDISEKMPIMGDIAESIGMQNEPSDVATKVYSTKTDDGWTLSLNRYTSKDPAVKVKAAVILCHGFNLNNKFWDLDKTCSLARYLTRNGYDVWAPSLRGSGLSSKPLIADVRNLIKLELVNIPQTLMRAPMDLTKFDWNIDDHILRDVPAIINLVKSESGFKKVYWIGHSMGGIIMFGYLETKKQDDIAGFVPISTMMFIHHPLSHSLETISKQKPLLTASLLINTNVASQLRNVTFGTVKNPIEELLMKRDNMEDRVVFRFFRLAIDDTSPGVVSQFSDSIRKGKMISSDGQFNYTNALKNVKVPIFIMGGNGDGFVTEEGLKSIYDSVSSKDKSVAIFSQANGYSADYGHCDLILGRNSEKEVYPAILNWLNGRAHENISY
ncbi:MAG: alpha/beta fold hydrolase [Candidatus Omnitrophota bacterium]|nr:alpha/beta fold hydrolase [Candidatus Omnitrophota bacterium]